MGYLNEDGLATLVGKVKGQVVQLTSAEYRNLPASKNSDNKTYFVTDEDYAYAIDDEPTLNSDNLVKSGGVYTYTSKIGSGTLTTTAQTIIPAINELKASVNTLNTGLNNVQNKFFNGSFSSSNPLIIQSNTFASYIFITFAQGIGSLVLAITKEGTTVKVRNLMTGGDFSSEYLKFTAPNNGTLKIESTLATDSTYTCMMQF